MPWTGPDDGPVPAAARGRAVVVRGPRRAPAPDAVVPDAVVPDAVGHDA
ncbi:hypothetical protein [Geodermatophilus sp. DF01-2]|nr:hypothetical protein [Geodermatophilus sp. DF01_2]